MRWAEIAVETPTESIEAVTALLLEAGSKGVAERDENPVVITGFLPMSPRLPVTLDSLEDRLAKLPDFGLSAPIGFRVSYIDDKDWENEWKKGYKPLEIGRRLVIKPSWECYRGDADRVIVELDPGMAFGTGGHPTTRLCLMALEDYVPPGAVVGDIGTGSGILAIAAARLGASLVHATDLDSLPRQIASENVAKNGLEAVVIVHEIDEFDSVAQGCDLVVANIIASTIVDLAPSVRNRLNPAGIFIAGGIVEERLEDVLQALDRSGFQLLETRSDEVWRATIAKRRDGVLEQRSSGPRFASCEI